MRVCNQNDVGNYGVGKTFENLAKKLQFLALYKDQLRVATTGYEFTSALSNQFFPLI